VTKLISNNCEIYQKTKLSQQISVMPAQAIISKTQAS